MILLYGIIYKVTNSINGKIYVGQTTKELKERIKGHYDAHKNPKNIFHKALKKYGFENFNWCVIDFAESQGELDIKEEFWIKFYKSYVGFEDSNGYNSTSGGRDGFYFYDEVIKKMSESQKEWIEENGHPKGMLGKTHSKETITKFKKHRKRSRNSNSKKVVKLSKEGEFIKSYECMRDVSDDIQKEFNNNDIDAVPHISQCCKGKIKSAYGYIWMYKNEYNKFGIRSISKNKNKRSVIQLDINGNYIREFESIKEASEYIKVLPRSLSRCLSGKRKTCGGYRWIYKDFYDKEKVNLNNEKLHK